MTVPVHVRVEITQGTHRWMGQGPYLLTALDGLVGVLPDIDSDEGARALHDAIGPTDLRIRIESGARWWNPASWGRSTLHIERLPGHIYRAVR